ncbi:MAG: carbonic anhydrase [Sulfurimonas sp.]|jgi:carbonic anhydrase|uniref:carbonic anhydrase n=1 Tax=Sulfurimonas sp. TaxID=2022749 RepID=UPI0039E41A16
MDKINKYIKNNKLWAAKMTKDDPEYFKNIAKSQHPELLWIGCSDSRVPAEIIVGAAPGEMFIHRNIANQVIATDFNFLSVLQYAVTVLKVKHIIVCGHYGCGGIQAALQKQKPNLLVTNKWLMHIKNTYRLYQNEVDVFETEEERVNKLVEINTIEQVHAVSHSLVVQESWDKHGGPIIHGWVYGLADGLVKELITLGPGHQIDPIYQYEPQE